MRATRTRPQPPQIECAVLIVRHRRTISRFFRHAALPHVLIESKQVTIQIADKELSLAVQDVILSVPRFDERCGQGNGRSIQPHENVRDGRQLHLKVQPLSSRTAALNSIDGMIALLKQHDLGAAQIEISEVVLQALEPQREAKDIQIEPLRG